MQPNELPNEQNPYAAPPQPMQPPVQPAPAPQPTEPQPAPQPYAAPAQPQPQPAQSVPAFAEQPQALGQQPMPTAPVVQPQPFGQPQPAPVQPMPQPAQQFPQQPTPATQTPFTSVGSGPAYTPGGDSRKKLFMLGGIAAGVVVLLIVIAIVLMNFFTVTKDDYAASTKEADAMRTAYTGLIGVSYVSSSATEVELQNSLDTLEKNRKELDEAIEGMADDKAIRVDGEAKKYYEALVKKKESFDKAMDAVAEAYGKVAPGISKYGDAYKSSDPSAVLASITAVRGELEGLELTDENNKTFIAATIAMIKEQETLLPKIIAGRKDYRQYDSSVSNAYYDSIGKFSDAARDWSSNMEKMADDSEINEEINDLGEYLTKKSYEE